MAAATGSAWARCRGVSAATTAPLDMIDAIYLWAAGEGAIAARAVQALLADRSDVPLVVGSGPAVPGWVGGGTLTVLVDRAGEAVGGSLLTDLLARGGPVLGVTGDARLAELLAQADQPVLATPDDPAVLPPIVVPLLEVLEAEDVAEDLAGWAAPTSWEAPEGLPLTLAAAAAGVDVPAMYGSDGLGAVGAEWMAAQLRLFTGRGAVSASFSDALAHLASWEGGGGVRPVAWLVADQAQAGVAEAFDQAVEGVVTVHCEAATAGGRLAELVGLGDLVAVARAKR